MKENPLSSIEKEFVLQAIQHKKRVDGRGPYDYRDVKVEFGVDWGSCHVTIGKTHVMAACSSRIVPPKQSRPQEGSLFLCVDLSQMASPGWEAGSRSTATLTALLNRQMERAVKLSKCVDMEGLCIIAHEQVWEVRLDVHILCHQGNVMGASLLAAMAALSHFRRPDVSVDDGIITVHPPDVKELIALSVMHIPLGVSFSLYDEGKYMLVDPTLLEERVKVGEVVVTMNKHREICALHTTGGMTLTKEQISRCTNIAWRKVQWMSQLLEEALKNDSAARARKEPHGFAERLRADDTLTSSEPLCRRPIERDVDMKEEVESGNEPPQQASSRVAASELVTDGGDGEVGEGGVSSWDILPSADKRRKVKAADKSAMEHDGSDGQGGDHGDQSSGSEEEDVMVLQPEKSS